MNWYPGYNEFEFLWNPPEYWGPFTDLSTAGDPVSSLDAAAMRHDIAYDRASLGRAGRIQRMEADAQMARETTGLSSAFMTVQSGFRLLTMNRIPLLWD